MKNITKKEVREILMEELKGQSADIKIRVINAIQTRVNILRDAISNSGETFAVIGIWQDERYSPWGIENSVVRELIVKYAERFGFQITGTLDGIETVGLSNKTYNKIGVEV